MVDSLRLSAGFVFLYEQDHDPLFRRFFSLVRADNRRIKPQPELDVPV